MPRNSLSRIPLRCLLRKQMPRVSISILTSCSMSMSCVPLPPRRVEAVLAEAESVMLSAAPNKNASVVLWLKRMGPLPRLLRTSLSPSRRNL